MRDEPASLREVANSTCKEENHFVKQAPDVGVRDQSSIESIPLAGRHGNTQTNKALNCDD